MSIPVPVSFDDLSAAWLDAILRERNPSHARVVGLTVEPLGAFVGFVGDLARVRPEYEENGSTATAGPTSLIVKLPTQEPGGRRVGDMLNAYAREVAFYNEVAVAMPEVSVPGCLYASGDPATGQWVVVLEDCPSDSVDVFAGATLAQAEATIEVLATLHARWWRSERTFDWMPGFDTAGPARLQEPWLREIPVFLDRYAERLPGDTGVWVDHFAPRLSTWSAKVATEPLTIVHTDCRLDNLLFYDSAVTIIDWQTALRGPAAMDVSCFIATSLTTEARRAWEPLLIERYVEQLAAVGTDIDPEWFEVSYDENLLWWMGQFAHNLARLEPDDDTAQRSLDTMIDRTFTTALDRNVGRLLP